MRPAPRAALALQGFLFGLAVVIVVRQAAVVLDVETRQGNVFVRGWDIAAEVHHWRPASAAIGLACLLLLVIFERFLPWFPGSLVVLALAAATTQTLDLFHHGVAHVVEVPAGLPHLALPRPAPGEWPALAGSAAGLALLSFVLGHGIGQRLSGGSAGPLDPNREMVGLGFANLLAGLVGGATVTASPSASSAAHHAGARTRWTPTLTAGLLLVVAVALTPAFRWLPEPALAAVVIMAVRPFLSLAPLRAYASSDRRSLAVALTAITGVMTLTLIPGLLLAVALSLLIFIADASQLRVSSLGRTEEGAYLDVVQYPNAVRPTVVKILRPDGQLFFANVDRLVTAVDEALTPGPGDRDGSAVILIDLTASFGLTLPAVDGLQTARRHVEEAGRALWFVHAYLQTKETLIRGPLHDVPIFTTIDDAVAAAAEPADKDQRPLAWETASTGSGPGGCVIDR